MDGDLRLNYDKDGNLLYEKPGPASVPTMTGPHFANLTTSMEQQSLDGVSNMLIELVGQDEESRTEWEEINADALKLLGVGPESDPDEVDDPAADTSDHPLLLMALTRFMSKALSAMIPSEEQMVNFELGFNPSDIPDREQRHAMEQDANEAGIRVTRFYTNYLKNQLPSYIEETDLLMMEMGLNGLGVRKVYTDMSRPHAPVQAVFVPAIDILISYDAKNFRTGRITHRMHMETPDLIRMMASGQYREVANLNDGDTPDKDAVTQEKDRIVGLTRGAVQATQSHKIYEVHCEMFLAEDPHPMGLARPYIVTIHAQTMEVLSIVRNWRPNDQSERRIEHFVGYLFHPGKSAVYGMGLGHILANVTRALRKGQRRGLEAAYLQNHPSGFKLSNFKIRDDTTKIRSGEFIDVDGPTGDIRASLMMQPFEGPSQGLMALMEKMESNGKQLGGTATQDLDNLMKAGMAAGPAMAAHEEATEFQTSIHNRLYRGNATEFTLIHERMREVVGQKPVQFGDNEMLRPGDLMKVKILPKMKPGQASKQTRVLEAQAVVDLAAAFPQEVDRRKAAEDYLRAIGKPNFDEILLPDPNKEPPPPLDPASEYARLMQGMPIRAGMQQHHMAHIDAHSAQMQGVQTSQLPVEQGEQIMAALAAHIAEHYSQDMVVKTAAAMGIPVEQMGEKMPPEMEAQLAPQMAEVIAKIEADRAPPEEQGDSKIAVEQAKGTNAQQLETMRQTHAKEMQTMKDQHAMALQKAKDDAAMARAEQDDDTSIEIASMKDPNQDRPKAGTISS